jgi:hypothetical protein
VSYRRRRPEFFLINGGQCAGPPLHPLFTLHGANPPAPPPMQRLKAQVLIAAEMLANEVDAARLRPDQSPAGVALLGLLDAVHELQHHESRRGVEPDSPGFDDLSGPDAS